MGPPFTDAPLHSLLGRRRLGCALGSVPCPRPGLCASPPACPLPAPLVFPAALARHHKLSAELGLDCPPVAGVGSRRRPRTAGRTQRLSPARRSAQPRGRPAQLRADTSRGGAHGARAPPGGLAPPQSLSVPSTVLGRGSWRRHPADRALASVFGGSYCCCYFCGVGY